MYPCLFGIFFRLYQVVARICSRWACFSLCRAFNFRPSSVRIYEHHGQDAGRCLRKFDLFRLITGCTYAPAAEAQKRRTLSHDAVLMSLFVFRFRLRKRRSNSSRDVRIRIRPGVVRVRISETAIRTVVRVAATNPQLSFSFAYLATSLGEGFPYSGTSLAGGGFPHAPFEVTFSCLNFLFVLSFYSLP